MDAAYSIRLIPRQIEPPLDINWLAEWFGVEVEIRPLPTKVAGLYLRTGSGAHVILNSGDSPERQRWTTAHELAHHVLSIGKMESCETFQVQVRERDHAEDIPLLVRHFIARFHAQTGRDVRDVSREALAALMRYDFPGNVRELENAVEHAFVLCRGKSIDLCCLPPEIGRPVMAAAGTEGVPGAFDQAEAAVIRKVLAQNGGHRVRTAQALGIHKATLLRKMHRFGISYP